MMDFDDTRPDEFEDREWLALSLAKVLGHTKTTTALRERVRARRHDTGIIIHGPRSVGKRTLARLYARAIACEDPTEAGEACGGTGQCTQCPSFIASRPIGHIWLDAIKQGVEETVRELVEDLNRGSLAARRVVVVANADRCTSKAFDTLLKTIEAPVGSVTFILLAQSLSEVRLAGQSRCELYRLRPLAPEAAREHLVGMLAAAGTQCDEKVIDLLVAETGGRVGAMRTIVPTVAARPNVTLAEMRTILGYDWVDGVAAFWRAALSADESSAEALVPPPAVDARKAQRHVRAMLLWLRPSSPDALARALYEPEPALVHQDRIHRELSSMLKARAAASGQPASGLWRALADLWLSDDYGDAEGLWEATRQTRQILTSAALKPRAPSAADASLPFSL